MFKLPEQSKLFELLRGRKPDGVFFDLDGTLFERENMLHEAIAQEVRHAIEYHIRPQGLRRVHPHQVDAAYFIEHFSGAGIRDIYGNILEKTGISKEHYSYNQFSQFVGQNLDRLLQEAQEGLSEPAKEQGVGLLTSCAYDTLDFIRNIMDVPVGLGSNGSCLNISLIADCTGLSDFCCRDAYNVVSGDSDFAPKPAPDMLARLAKNADIKPDQNQKYPYSLFTGNAPSDMRAAKAAGMIAVGILEAAKPEDRGILHKSLKKAGADIIFERMDNFYDALIALHQQLQPVVRPVRSEPVYTFPVPVSIGTPAYEA